MAPAMTQDAGGHSSQPLSPGAASGARQVIPVESVPVEPVSVQPIPVEPIPVEPYNDITPPPAPPPRRPPATFGQPMPPPQLPGSYLPYGQNFGSNRPGILTAVGVISIIVAAMSIIYSLIMGVTGFGMLVASSMSGAMSRARISTSAVTVSPSGTSSNADPMPVGPRGLERRPRQVVVMALTRVRPLPPQRQQMLEALLAQSGTDLFPFDPTSPSITPQTIMNNVSESGRLPSASNGREGADFYILGGGRLEVYDDHAVFAPSDGRDTIRVSTDDIASASGLSANDLESIIGRAQMYCGNRLSEAQVTALKSMLSVPGQTYVPTPPAGNGAGNRALRVGPAQQVYQAVVDGDGTATVMFTGGSITLKADGSLVNAVSSGMMTGPGGAMTMTTPVFKVSRVAATTVLIEAILSLGLAIFLLVSAILVLRQHRRGRLLHNLYAILKIPLVIVAVIGIYHLFNSLMRNMAQFGGAGGAPPSSVGAAYAMFAALGILYPIALLIVFQTRGVREYYNNVNG
jgi:hypothetical protein